MLNTQNFTTRHTGFTLVELMTVIILIGILAVSAFSRFSDTAGYAEYTYQARLISALRNMQTRAMHDNRAGYCFKINVDTATPAFGPPLLTYTPVGIPAETCSDDIAYTNPDYLRTSATEMADEGVSITTEPSLDFIAFDTLGRPTPASADCSDGCKITFTGEAAVSVCIEAEGYVHACE